MERNLSIFNPFDQFEVVRIIPFGIPGSLDISITNSAIYIGLSVILIVLLHNMIEGEKGGYSLIPQRWQSVMEIVNETIFEVVNDNIGKSGLKYYPFVLTLFLIIAIMNLIGIVPYTFAPTSHIVITFGLSLSIFLGVTLLGFVNYKWNYLSMFMPNGSPMFLAPFMVMIEILSHFAKAISLGVRLAANITAGHILFAILSGFTWKMLIAGGIISVLSIFPFLIVLFISIIEMAVALIQAYVFSLLTAIYISDSVHLH